jgi:hypothetical protein
MFIQIRDTIYPTDILIKVEKDDSKPATPSIKIMFAATQTTYLTDHHNFTSKEERDVAYSFVLKTLDAKCI